MIITQDILNRKVTGLRGDTFVVNFPTPQEIEDLPRYKYGNPDKKHLPKATVRTIVLDCMSSYDTSTRQQGHNLNILAQSFISRDVGELDLKDKFYTFLGEILESSVMRMDKVTQKGPKGQDFENEVTKGLYKSYLIDQVMEALGFLVEDKPVEN